MCCIVSQATQALGPGTKMSGLHEVQGVVENCEKCEKTVEAAC